MAKRNALPSQEILNQLLSYDKDSGLLKWKGRTQEFADLHNWSRLMFNCWNARFAGREITYKAGAGYLNVTVFGVKYPAHRVAWKMVYGVDPDHIDHIDGDKVNNRLENLRDVSATENQRNRKLNANNACGYPGVSFCKASGKWLARITLSSKTKYIGRFEVFSDAVAARSAAEKRHGFHENHGRAS